MSVVNSDNVAWNISEFGVITWSEEVVTQRRDTKSFLKKKSPSEVLGSHLMPTLLATVRNILEAEKCPVCRSIPVPP